MTRSRWLAGAADAELGRGPGPGAVARRGELVREAIAARVALDRIGRNLNQAVTVLNAGVVVDTRQLDAVLDRVDAAVARVDAATLAVTAQR